MLRAFGLYGHIQANRVRAPLLLAAFVLLLHTLLFSLLLLGSALLGGAAEEIVDAAIDQFSRAWPIASLAAAIVLISWGLSILIRFALSRTREFLADAGSAELTKNPDALASALRKIHANARLEVPSRMEAFFIDNPVSDRIGGLFSTHPPIETRIEALRRYAGAAAPA
jgi:Zn-dependent protease with chaperone function